MCTYTWFGDFLFAPIVSQHHWPMVLHKIDAETQLTAVCVIFHL